VDFSVDILVEILVKLYVKIDELQFLGQKFRKVREQVH